MANKKLTEHGKEFIRRVADYFNGEKGTNSLLQGNNGGLPYSTDLNNTTKIWVANIMDTRKTTPTPITTNDQYAEYLIYLFDKYAAKSSVDANVIAAQAFQESEYEAWTYVPVADPTSTASGVAQITMNTLYRMIYVRDWLTTDEKNTIVNGMESPSWKSSWHNNTDEKESDDDIKRQFANRSVLHQNMIDNIHICIKLQCKLMNFIAENNANLAASCLFAYNRGSEYVSNNFVHLINKTAKQFNNDYVIEGTNYTEAIFAYLGDQYHDKVDQQLRSYVRGYWFSYDQIDFGFDSFTSDSNSGYPAERSTKNPDILVTELKEGYDYAVAKFTDAHPGYSVTLTSVFRTKLYQNELYRKGDTPVSGIPPDISKHNYNKTKAFDFGLFDETGQYLAGKTIPAYRPLYKEFYDYVHEIVPNAVWGGGFQNLKNDVVHIQI